MKQKRIGLIIAALLFGVLVWVSVVMRDSYTVTVVSPLEVSGIPDGWAIKTDIPKEAHLRFRGDGWRLAALLLGPPSGIGIVYSAVPPTPQVITSAAVADRLTLRPGLQFLGMTPDSITLGVDHLSQKTVRVEPDVDVVFRDGYGQVGPMVITPESVGVTGAESALAGIEAWKTEHAAFQDARGPIDTRLPLLESAGPPMTLSQKAVRLIVNIQPFAEKVLPGIPVDIDSVPPPREVILIPPKIEVVVRGEIRQLSGLSPNDLTVHVPYARIESDTTGLVDVSIDVPQGIHVVRRRPDRLQYIVRKRL